MSDQRMTRDEWAAEGQRLFGDDQLEWAFECPACHHVAKVKDWQAAGLPENMVAFSCIGRGSKNPRDAFTTEDRKGPCNYAGGGLFRLNPITVIDGDNEHQVFAFATNRS